LHLLKNHIAIRQFGFLYHLKYFTNPKIFGARWHGKIHITFFENIWRWVNVQRCLSKYNLFRLHTIML